MELWYNLGCVLERTCNYEKAKQCFEYLIQLDSNNSKAYCGASLCCIHLKDMQTGLNYAKLAIEQDNENGLYYYLAALCSKSLFNNKDTMRYYNDFKATITGLKRNYVTNFIFGFLISHIVKSKKLAITCAKSYKISNEKLRSEYKEPNKNITGIERYCKPNGERIAFKSSKVIGILKSLQFFCRFSDLHLVKLISNCTFRSVPSNYLFLLNKDEVAVMLSGSAELQTYTTTLLSPTVLAHYSNWFG